jgi:precorrin-2/cobalt-factor-2 C20-methyltransferase
MKTGTFYGIGVGPGDPELVTVKAAAILVRCRHVFVPKARTASDSVALEIARRYLRDDAQVHELVFPMTSDAAELARCWQAAADQVVAVLDAGDDACFLTLGDSLLYSTYIYLLRALKTRRPDANIVTVPGITSFCAAAALTQFPIGEGKELVTIVPTANDLTATRRALQAGGTVVLMKIGKRLPEVLDALEEAGVIEQAVFVARAGLDGQRIETDLRKLRQHKGEVGYLSVILVHANKRSDA